MDERRGVDKDYIEDRKYIHETLKNNTNQLNNLNNNFADFKLTIMTAIAVIQTKLAIYVFVGTFAVSLIVNITISYFKD